MRSPHEKNDLPRLRRPEKKNDRPHELSRAPKVSALRQAYLCVFAALTLALYGCGGGGGSGSSENGGTSPPGTGQGSTPTGSLTPSVKSINATFDTSEGGGGVANPVSFTVPTSGTYYYELSFVGTAITGVALNGVTSTDYNTGNSAIGSTPALGYAIGATIHGSWNGDRFDINDIYFPTPAVLGAGVYNDALTLHVCQDAACTTELAGSPVTVPVTYTVTGNKLPNGTSTAYPNVEVEFPGSQTTPASASIIVEASGLPPTGAYVSAGGDSNRLVTQTSFSSSLATNAANVSSGTLNLSLQPPSTAGVGMHTDTFPINVCFDTGCQKPVAGSPWTANLTYIVDPVSGVDYTENTIDISTGGIVWDATTARLYAIIPTYSTLDPNTLATIDPSSGTIVGAAQLDGGVGHIELGTLAVSSDGQYLYVAVSDATLQTDHVERLRASDLGVDQTITLPAFETVAALAPAPGAPHTLAVLKGGNSPQLGIYDDATPRSNALAGQNGNTLISFTWGADSSTIYATLGGANAAVDAVSVTASGLQVINSNSSQNIQSAVALGQVMQFAGGLICWGSGMTFDPTTFALGNSFSPPTGAILNGSCDAPLDRAYFATTDQPPNSSTPTSAIEAFKLSTRAGLWILRLPSQNPPGQLTRWGSNGLAFSQITGGIESLHLISGPLMTH
jgi:hypothetical protein